MSTTTNRATTMKAIVQDRYGPPDVLEFRDTDRPAVGDHDVLVRVRAAAVNPADRAVTSGVPYIVRPGFGPLKPRNGVRGTDVAGTVETVGTNVTQFRPGNEVFGAGTGTFAQYACARQDQLVPKPPNITWEQAAAVPMAALVALQALRDKGDVQPGQKVLINGASGGIGTFAVQIAKAFGAEVTGVCSTTKVDLIRSIGADHVIDYTEEDFTQSGQRYDFILDNAANHSLSHLRRALTPDGTLVPNNGEFENRWMASLGLVTKSLVTSLFVRQNLRPFVSTPKKQDLVALSLLMESGKVTPVIDRTYPLRETSEAIGYVGAGHARGKVVIIV